MLCLKPAFNLACAMRVQTVRQLIDLLGTARDAALVLGTSQQNVANWRNAGSIPPRYFLVHQKSLRARGIEAPRHLWRCRLCGAVAAE